MLCVGDKLIQTIYETVQTDWTITLKLSLSTYQNYVAGIGTHPTFLKINSLKS